MADLTTAHIEKLREVLVGCAHTTQDEAILHTLCDMAMRAIAASSPLGDLDTIIAEYDGIVNGRLDPRDAEADFVMRGSDWRCIREALRERIYSKEDCEAMNEIAVAAAVAAVRGAARE